ncbi:PREDICTED: uncharacterized protein LOC104818212 [Tarenaya hassleriana]|uniref:uncharacterized protein LOC104818212 n=1 Tax=Tarenaya hassleriana TaxID=28532 RepID=UPI00053C6402|nr:PREDICTED: uncharacterized protein LOC104818212 [Tarenaya hassleriana]XP_019058598.1 PREDICTED: uncharacterized protein LOC104818212 [Tarenaya hassleriana]
MVLVTHKLQGSQILFPRSSPTWSEGLFLRQPVARVNVVGRKEEYLRLRQPCRLSLGAPCNGRLKAKPFGVTSFKGGIHNSDIGGSENGTKVTNNSVKLSYHHDDDENNLKGSPKAQNRSLSYTSDPEDSISGQPSIQKLFKKWLTMLCSQSPAEEINGVLEEQLPPVTKPETQTEIGKTERVQHTNTVWSLLWSLDATIKIPLLLFIPGFVAVNAIYGAGVTKELLPLWVIGPLVVALYIKMFQGLCALYAFCFSKTVNIVKNLPAYAILAYNYIIQGKLREDVRGFVVRPVVAIRGMDYRKVARTRLKLLQDWIVEKYLDFVESIWPYYCRTIRFLKRANLI